MLSFLKHHAGELVGWNWEPSVLIGLGLLTGVYELIGRRLRVRRPEQRWSNWQRFSFHFGTALVFVGLISPLDAVADHLLFSAHMVQHLLFMLAAPLLWLLGIPAWAAVELIPAGRFQRTLQHITQPMWAGLIWVSIMWIWHIPGLYDAALENEAIHIVEHLMFLAAGVIGWWPAFGPAPASIRFDPQPRQVLYLFLVTLPCTALAAILTLSNQVLYGFYGGAPRLLDLSPLLDQQLGGLMMWLPGDMVLVGATIVVLIRWMDRGAGVVGSGHQLRTEVT